MPSDPTVEEVRELLARAELCLNDGVSWAGPSIEIVAALCRHFLASPMTAGEFAGLVVKAIDVDLIDKEKLDKKREPTVEGRDECEHFLQAFQMARATIRRTAAEHNIEIVEPKK